MYIVLLTVDIYVAFILSKLLSHCVPLCLKIAYFRGYFWRYISLHTWLSSPSHLCHLPLKTSLVANFRQYETFSF